MMTDHDLFYYLPYMEFNAFQDAGLSTLQRIITRFFLKELEGKKRYKKTYRFFNNPGTRLFKSFTFVFLLTTIPLESTRIIVGRVMIPRLTAGGLS